MKEIVFFMLLFFGYMANAQDDCASAIYIQEPQNVCDILNFDEATASDTNGECVDVNSENNQWLSFEADGANFQMSAVAENGSNCYITIIRYTNLDCDPVKYVEVTCGVNVINEQDLLTEGELYHVIVNIENNTGGQVDYCLSNSHDTPPPVNNVSCEAYPVLTNNSCILVSNLYSENSIDSSYCGDSFTSDVWYKFTLANEYAFGVEVSLQDALITGDVQVQLVNFAFDSCGVEYVVRSYYCGPPEGMIFDNTTLVKDETYYIVVSTSEEDQGELFLCVNELIAAPNTYACEAFDIVPNGDCPQLNTYNSIFELDIVSCNYSNQNLWYRFYTAEDLTSVDLQLDQLSDENEVFLGIGYFMGNYCENNFTWVDTFCGNVAEAQLSIENLLPNQYYHIAVGSNFGFTGEYQLCVNGDYDSPYTNGSSCTAYGIEAFNGCTGGSSQYGSYTSNDSLCQAISNTNNTWYKTTLEKYDHSIEVLFTHLSSIPYENIEVGYFEQSCQDSFIVVNSYCGNDSIAMISAVFPDSIVMGYISVTLPANNIYNYSVCVNPVNFTVSCENNDFCQEAMDIGIVSLGQDICFEACTFGQTIENTEEFYTSRYPTSWYEFTTGSETQSLRFGFDNPSNPFYFIGLKANQDCEYNVFDHSKYIQLTENNSVEFFLEPSTTYQLAVTAVNTFGGEVDICISANESNICATDEQLFVLSTSVGSPREGPYQEGEIVEFCYLLPRFQITDEVSCQWLQGIVPIFGDSWDPQSFDILGQPNLTHTIQSISDDVTWGWRNDVHSKISNENILLNNDGICHTTGENCIGNPLETGDELPAGWYAWNTEQAGMHPDSTYGDGQNCQNAQGPWQVCFQLKVGEISADMDLGIEFYTFADGEIGYVNPADTTCKNDKPLVANFYSNCETVPTDTTLTILTCNENTTIIELPENQYYFWLVDENPNISGASSGSGNELSITLSTTSTHIERLNYYISAYSAGGCHMTNYRAQVSVYPSLDIARANTYNLCQGDSVSLSQVIDLQSQIIGDFDVDWVSNIVIDEPNAFWGGNLDSSIPYQVISEAGCTFADTIFIHVEDVIVSEYLDTYTVCRGNNLAFDEVLDLEEIITDSFTVDWQYPGLDDVPAVETSFQQSTNIPFTLTGEFGCTFQDTFRVHVPHVNINVLGKAEYCSTDTVSISAGYIFDLPHEKFWILPQGDTIFGSGIARKASLFDEGENYLQFQLFTEEGCPFYDYDTITMYTYPEFTFNQDSQFLGICPYDSLLLDVDVTPSHYGVTWQTPTGLHSEPTFYTTDPGLYAVSAGIATDAVQCMNRDSFYLEIYDPVNTEIIYDPIVCIGDSSTAYSTDPNYKFIWSNGDPSSQTIVPPGSYTVTVSTAENCIEIFEIDITERGLPQPDFTYDEEICAGDSTSIVAENNQYDFEWSTGELTSDIISFGGIEMVTVTDDENCVDSFDLEIEVLEYPETALNYTLNQDTLFLPGLDGIAESCNYLLNDEVIISPDDMVLLLDEGNYTLSLTCANGDCSVTFVDSFSVIIIGVKPQSLDNVVIYPNPNTGQFVLDMGGIQDAKAIYLYEPNGKKVYDKDLKTGESKFQIDTELPSGFYIVKIETENQVILSKMIID